MGKPGGAAAKKSPGTAISPRNGVRAVLTEPGQRFDPPDHIERPEALSAWEAYWNDPVSSVVTEADHPLLVRWIDLQERYWNLMEAADAEPTVITNANGMLANPLYKIALGIGSQISKLEYALGIGPKNRLGLGIQIIQQEQGKRNLERGGPRPIPAVVDEDPRLM